MKDGAFHQTSISYGAWGLADNVVHPGGKLQEYWVGETGTEAGLRILRWGIIFEGFWEQALAKFDHGKPVRYDPRPGKPRMAV